MKTNLDRIKNDIEELAKFNSSIDGGLTRFSLTPEDRMARDYLKSELQKLNLEIYEDTAGTIFGRREGTDKNAKAILLGSHFDSVKNGGNFDGPAGVVMALEIMRALDENNISLKNPIEFVAMIEEEGGRFGSGVFASRAMVGLVDYAQLERNKDKDGISMADAFRKFGFDPTKIEEAKKDKEKIKAFIELHIEQGPILEKESKDVGIVEFIVGINEFKVTISGKADHAGTTPMDMRSDSVLAASKVISKTAEYAMAEKNGTVVTVGFLEVKPGATNIVAKEAIFTVDIRSKSRKSIETVKAKIIKDLETITKETATNFEILEMLNADPVEMNPSIVEMFKKSAEEIDLSYKMMISGAGHDAMIMSQITDVGLVFVPSKGGKSHSKDEWTDYDQLQKGIELVYETVIKLGEE
ncbi:MAG: Zn-dependent hydrolase [Tissierellia bacterium]|nr:Zn-dependent hydrolase [Tissierellia bacterium]